MYANLRVHAPGHATHLAWRVLARPDGGHVVYLDANKGESSYYVPAGTVEFGPGEPLEITADF